MITGRIASAHNITMIDINELELNSVYESSNCNHALDWFSRPPAFEPTIN